MYLVSNNLNATQFTIGNDTIQHYNGNYYIYGLYDTILIDSTIVSVKFSYISQSPQISYFEAQNNLTIFRTFNSKYKQYLLPVGRNYVSICNDISDDPIVENLTIHFYYSIPVEEDQQNQNADPYLDNIGVWYDENNPGAWNLTRGDTNIVVAVIDAGLSWDNYDFGAIENEYDVVKHNFSDPWLSDDDPQGNDEDEDGNGYFNDMKGWDFNNIELIDNCAFIKTSDNDVRPTNEFWHGNGVAGIIGAKANNSTLVDGIGGGDIDAGLYGLKILPIKVLDIEQKYESGECHQRQSFFTAEIESAINYAVGKKANVINMSLSVPSGSHGEIDVFKDAIQNAYDSGVIMVASSGNTGYNYVNYPARSNYVIAVGATTDLDEWWEQSSYGAQMEIVAPGVNIELIEHDYQTVVNSGTSFSTPMVSATIGLMLSVNPYLSNGGVEEEGSVRNILSTTADKTGGQLYDENLWNEKMGFGRLNTYKAVCKAIDYIPEIDVTENQVWTNKRYSPRNIIIESGVNLKISGELMMGKDAKIIVKTGGVLTVENGKITHIPYCGRENDTWSGIEVWGNPNNHQYAYPGHPQAQGKVVLDNAVIENAQTAIRTRKDWNSHDYSGGIIIAKNSIFKNNRISIDIAGYKNIFNSVEYDNECKFKECTFLIDEGFMHNPLEPIYQVFMWEVKGVKFYGCTFLNELNASAENTYGISTWDAGFTVKGICGSNTVPCSEGDYVTPVFNGFFKAIQAATSISKQYLISIQDGVFTNNGFGIHLISVNDAVVVNNSFELGQHYECVLTNTGILLDNSKRFAIENNLVFINGVPAACRSHGIVTKNTNNDYDEIYKNDFEGLLFANVALEKNWGSFYQYGLNYICNKNRENETDFLVYGEKSPGIQEFQGNLSFVAGNAFSPTASWHFDNWAPYEIYYFYNENISNEEPVKVLQVIPMKLDLQNLCPDHYLNNDIRLSSTAYQQAEASYVASNQSYLQYSNLLDSIGGLLDSTELLKLEGQVSYFNMLKNRAAYDIIRSNMADSITHPDLYKTWMEELNSFSSTQDIIDMYIHIGEFQNAMELLDTLPSTYPMSSYDSAEFTYYSDLKQLQLGWLNDNRSIFELSETELEDLGFIAENSKGLGGAQARGILGFAYGNLYNFMDCNELDISNNLKNSSHKPDTEPSVSSTAQIVAKPNPANDVVDFVYTLSESDEKAEIRIYSGQGTLIDVLSISSSTGTYSYQPGKLFPGVYVYVLISKNGSVQGKLIIVR